MSYYVYEADDILRYRNVCIGHFSTENETSTRGEPTALIVDHDSTRLAYIWGDRWKLDPNVSFRTQELKLSQVLPLLWTENTDFEQRFKENNGKLPVFVYEYKKDTGSDVVHKIQVIPVVDIPNPQLEIHTK